jgi:hypothetical protein
VLQLWNKPCFEKCRYFGHLKNIFKGVLYEMTAEEDWSSRRSRLMGRGSAWPGGKSIQFFRVNLMLMSLLVVIRMTSFGIFITVLNWKGFVRNILFCVWLGADDAPRVA